jgi:tRNA dimethylallyltransferase
VTRASSTNAHAWFLTGPTAVGKSAIALELAERVGGEIVSVDSMQVYRGLDLGTAKPPAAERARVPHHLIDVAELTESFDVARFVALATVAETGIRARGRVPVYCGGTGFYLKALLEGVSEAPPANPALRMELASLSLEQLLAELAEQDPAAFAVIDRRNPRRVIRALEVIRLTGRPFSEHRPARTRPESTLFRRRLIAFQREPGDLRRRIEARVDRMFADGLVAETRALLERGLASNRTAMQALGYRQVTEHLEGRRGLEETMALVKTRTWQFARRQMTWLRNQFAPGWVDLPEGSRPAAVADELVRRTRGQTEGVERT